jgi:signal transduction histidine kinase
MMFVIWSALFRGPVFGIPGPLVIGTVAVFLAGCVAVLPATRRTETALARSLLGDAAASLSAYPVRLRGPQWRAGGWYVLHLALGSIATMFTCIAPFALVTCLTAPFVDGVVVFYSWRSHTGWAGVPVAVGGVVVVAVAVAVVAGCGTLLARCAGKLLGPSATERLADLEHQSRVLAERNRLARELHDSIGHALTVATLQAGTAHRLFDRDPAFARQALAAIAETGRAAMADLDHVVGLLRDGTSTQIAPGLGELDRLLDVNRGLGVGIEATITGSVADLPGPLSRELFRIVQESLTNVITHAGRSPVTLRIAATPDHVELEVRNPLTVTRRIRTRSGGHGLRGMRERVDLLRGEMSARSDGAQWRVRVRLPVHPTP